jgi:hypothetical protein
MLVKGCGEHFTRSGDIGDSAGGHGCGSTACIAADWAHDEANGLPGERRDGRVGKVDVRYNAFGSQCGPNGGLDCEYEDPGRVEVDLYHAVELLEAAATVDNRRPGPLLSELWAAVLSALGPGLWAAVPRAPGSGPLQTKRPRLSTGALV